MRTGSGPSFALALLAIGGCLLAATPAALAAVPSDGELDDVLLPVDEDDILILEVLVERYRASQGVLGYRHGDQVLLPLGELAAVLELAITADPYTGVAEGWINEESNTFRLDIAARQVTLGDHQRGLDEACLYVDADDIYVRSDVLSRWWPVDVDIDLRGMRVALEAREPVPLVSRLERERARERLERGSRSEEQYPRRKGEYRTLGWPFLDATLAWDTNRDRTRLMGSMLGRIDLLRMSATGFAGYTERSRTPWTAWLRGERRDPDGDLLGPLRATEVQVGDVVGGAIHFIKGTTRGRGFMVGNRPLGAVTRFDETDVTGDAPPGWEAELYRDGYLHAIQTVGESGTYLFEDIPIHPGMNALRVVLYGPNGQTREDVSTVNITSSMWQPGRMVYEVLSHQSGESVLGTATSTYPPTDQGHWLHSLALGYGIAPGSSVDLSAVRRWADGRYRDYLQARGLQSLGHVLVEARGAQDLDGGHALSLSMQSRLANSSILLSHGRFNDFRSDERRYDQNLRHETQARLSGSLRPRGRDLLHYRLNWEGRAYTGEDLRRRDLLRLYLGRSVARFQVGHDLDYSRVDAASGDRAHLLGRLQASGFVRGVRMRLDADYDLLDDVGLNAVGVGLNWRATPDLSSQFSARRQLRGVASTTVQANLDWHLRAVRLGLRAGYDTETEHYIGVSATTSIARAPDGGWHLSSRSSTRNGAALVRAYVDHDRDGAFGEGDEPLEDVEFLRNALWRGIATDEDGYAFLPGLTADRFVNVLVNLESVPDPYLVTDTAGLTTLVHGGGVASLDFPFHVVGEIEGVVLSRPEMRPMRNVGLELIDEHGERVATTVTEFDGYYVFGRVPPGRYLVRVVMETLHHGRYAEPEPGVVEVPERGDYVAGPTIHLDRIGLEDIEPLVADATPEPEVDGEAAPEAIDEAEPAPVVAVVGEAPAAAAREQAPAVEPAASDRPAEAGSTEPIAAESGPVAAASADAQPDGAAVDPDVRRTMHLIHEILFESPLFAR